jgi:hypothetical protein
MMKYLLFLLWLLGCSPPPISHSFFIAGPSLTGIINESGQVEWDAGRPAARDGYVLSNGNILVPHLLAFAVKEYSPSGEVLRIFKTDLEELGGRQAENWPFTAIRLANGNTVINLTHGNKTIEVNSAGEVVWQMGNEDVEGNPFQDPCGVQRLAKGNTVIASYGAQEGIKLFEVTPEKKIVWRYSGDHRVHHFQILTTNGVPLNDPPLK